MVKREVAVSTSKWVGGDILECKLHFVIPIRQSIFGKLVLGKLPYSVDPWETTLASAYVKKPSLVEYSSKIPTQFLDSNLEDTDSYLLRVFKKKIIYLFTK